MCVSLLATGVASCRGESDASEIERPHLPHCYSLGGVLLPPTLLLQPREVTTKVLHSCYKGCYSLGKLLQSCHRVATELLQSCYTVLQHWDFCSTAPTVFATSCYKVATELLQTCYKVATKLLQPRQVATKLLQSVFVSVLDEVFLEQKMSSSIFLQTKRCSTKCSCGGVGISCRGECGVAMHCLGCCNLEPFLSFSSIACTIAALQQQSDGSGSHGKASRCRDRRRVQCTSPGGGSTSAW